MENDRIFTGSTGEFYNKDNPTLRDRFAMAALTGLLAQPKFDGERDAGYDPMPAITRRAYQYADGMLTARSSV